MSEATANPTNQDTDYDVTQVPVVGQVPKDQRIVDWVTQTAQQMHPSEIRYCDGSDDEWNELVDLLVKKGSAIRLNEQLKPNSVYLRTDPDDVARVEDQTFICSLDENDAGPTNNWMHPRDMKATMGKLYDGCMAGRTMYVVPFCMGRLNADDPKFGIEVSDSAYVVLSMKIMTTMGTEVMDAIIDHGGKFVPCLHSVGMPLAEGEADVPWPCNDTKYISHFPEDREIWSYGSGYGGNSLLGKKCYALRIASVMARDEGWLAEHMLILKLTSPEGKSHVICAAFPSACGKTNLAMLEPTLPGWKAETIGDDIAWLRPGPDGRLYAVNPEAGFFGVAPGTGHQTNPNAMRTIERGNSIFTNVALTDNGDIWWEGMTTLPPKHLTDWRGRSWTPDEGPEGGRPNEKAAHANSRFTTPIGQCPTLAEEFYSPNGVPVDIIVFGGRRQNTIPLVNEARDWTHGVFLGATMSSETTAAAKGALGVLRRDPMAMLPFIGYHVADYFQHWLDVGAAMEPAKLPKIFYVNWFRKDADGRFMWPGFGENSRVLKWMVDRLEGRVEAVETPIGELANPADFAVEGLSIPDKDLGEVLSYQPQEWVDEVPRLEAWLKSLGPKVPQVLMDELDRLAKAVSA